MDLDRDGGQRRVVGDESGARARVYVDARYAPPS
jgi:hypothetical protein